MATHALILQKRVLGNFSLFNFRLFTLLPPSLGSWCERAQGVNAAQLKGWFGGRWMSKEARAQRSKGAHVTRKLDQSSGTRLRSLSSEPSQNFMLMQVQRGRQPPFQRDDFESSLEDRPSRLKNHQLYGNKNSTTQPSSLDNQPRSAGEIQPNVKRNEPVTQPPRAKASTLVYTLMRISNVKEEVYSALDSWTAWDYKFPMVAVKRALKMLKDRQQWQRIIQISKWMLSKGQGKTMGTYDLLIQALDEDGRLEEAEVVWNTLVLPNIESVPRMMYARMIAIYEKHGMLDKLFKVFKDMEDMSVKPDEGTINRVARAYEKLGLLEKKEKHVQKYTTMSTESKIKAKGAKGRIKERKKS